MNWSHHRVPLSLQALKGRMAGHLFCLSFPQGHGPRPCFHCSLWEPTTSGPVLELLCSVSLGRAEVGQLKPCLKSGGHHVWDRAPAAVLEGMHWGRREYWDADRAQISRWGECSWAPNSWLHQNTPLGFCRLVACSTGGLLGTEFPMKRRAETLEYSPGGANLCLILEISSLVEQLSNKTGTSVSAVAQHLNSKAVSDEN